MWIKALTAVSTLILSLSDSKQRDQDNCVAVGFKLLVAVCFYSNGRLTGTKGVLSREIEVKPPLQLISTVNLMGLRVTVENVFERLSSSG